jgi:hypothetical protein
VCRDVASGKLVSNGEKHWRKRILISSVAPFVLKQALDDYLRLYGTEAVRLASSPAYEPWERKAFERAYEWARQTEAWWAAEWKHTLF